jgi:hypothetical protein
VQFLGAGLGLRVVGLRGCLPLQFRVDFTALDELVLPQPYSWKVASLRQLTGWLSAEITVLEQVTADLLAGHDAYRAVQELPGIGPVPGRGRRDRRHHPVPPPGPAVLMGRADPPAL